MLRPTSWDDTPGPRVDHRLLLELMWLVSAQGHDRDDTGSIERAHVPRRTDAEINAHLDHLAALGLVRARARYPGTAAACAPSPTRAARGTRSTSTRSCTGTPEVCGRMEYRDGGGRKLGWLEKVPTSDLARGWMAASHEIRPTHGVLVARTRGRTARPHAGPLHRLDVVRWGLVPRAWARPLRDLPDTWNARSETVATRPSYAPAWRGGRRCVLLVSAAIEFPKGVPRQKGVPAPRVAITRVDGGLLAMAGLWEAWRDPHAPDPAQPWLTSCTLLTTVPNGVIASVHHRMPVVLAPDQIDLWLDPELPLAEAQALCAPCPDAALRVAPVAAA